VRARTCIHSHTNNRLLRYWVDRSALVYGAEIYACPRETCIGAGNSSCWLSRSYNGTLGLACDADELLCAEGSQGPLCGSCRDGWTFNNALGTCVGCSSKSDNTVPIAIGLTVLGLGLVVLVLSTNGYRLPEWVLNAFPFNVFKHVSSSMLKVMMVFQIVSTLSWNLNITFPEPMSSFLSLLSFFSFDFVSLDCVSGESNFFNRVYVVSFTPIFLAALNGAVYLIRIGFTASITKTGHDRLLAEQNATVMIETAKAQVNKAPQAEKHAAILKQIEVEAAAGTAVGAALVAATKAREIASQHVWSLLLLSYLVLPACSMAQFQALVCETFPHDGTSFLLADSNIDCNSPQYRNFLAVDVLLVFFYQSIPLVWFLLLWRQRKKLNPPRSGQNTRVILRNRAHDKDLAHLLFLFGDYRPECW
jgi:hypothetical protein